ncbi:MAG: hypothetical protein K9L30_08860 [Desulfobacterales bacterium]|nr:hypothetical protein [Desulfobacterales bacterium]
MAEAEEKAYRFPGGVIISNISFPDDEIFSGGVTSIYFYNKGYSDKTVIHIEGDGRQLSVIIEPFLANVQIEDGHINIDG